MKQLSIPQLVLACVGLVGITVLSALDKVSADAVIAIYSAVVGGALGYVNGKKAGGS